MSGWIDVLRVHCNASSQKKVAERVGYSVTVINQVLGGTYKGDLQRVQAAVEGALMQSEVDCPVIGSLPRQRCVEYQRRPFTPTSPMNVQLYRACRDGCQNALNSAAGTPRIAQPAVAQNTGSRDGAPSSSTTRPTGPRKGLSNPADKKVPS